MIQACLRRRGIDVRRARPGGDASTAPWKLTRKPSAAPISSRSNRDRIDGIIVTLPNFGDERAIADTLRLADLDVPVLVQATPDDAAR